MGSYQQPRLRVRDDLYSFLRSRQAICEQGPFWIDAICIDQAFVVERNHQVGLMHSIYTGAPKVYIWLGPGSLQSQWLFNDLASSDDLESLRIAMDKIHSRPSSRKAKWLAEALDRIRLNPYWQRLWIIQECLSAQRLILWHGENSLEWDRFDALVGLLESGEAVAPLQHHTFRRLGAWRSKADQRPMSQTLEDLIINYGSLNCHDPRDHVYALLGLVNLTAMDDLYGETLQVDYDLPLPRLLARVMGYCRPAHPIRFFRHLLLCLGLIRSPQEVQVGRPSDIGVDDELVNLPFRKLGDLASEWPDPGKYNRLDYQARVYDVTGKGIDGPNSITLIDVIGRYPNTLRRRLINLDRPINLQPKAGNEVFEVWPIDHRSSLAFVFQYGETNTESSADSSVVPHIGLWTMSPPGTRQDSHRSNCEDRMGILSDFSKKLKLKYPRWRPCNVEREYSSTDRYSVINVKTKARIGTAPISFDREQHRVGARTMCKRLPAVTTTTRQRVA